MASHLIEVVIVLVVMSQSKRHSKTPSVTSFPPNQFGYQNYGAQKYLNQSNIPNYQLHPTYSYYPYFPHLPQYSTNAQFTINNQNNNQTYTKSVNRSSASTSTSTTETTTKSSHTDATKKHKYQRESNDWPTMEAKIQAQAAQFSDLNKRLAQSIKDKQQLRKHILVLAKRNKIEQTRKLTNLAKQAIEKFDQYQEMQMKKNQKPKMIARKPSQTTFDESNLSCTDRSSTTSSSYFDTSSSEYSSEKRKKKKYKSKLKRKNNKKRNRKSKQKSNQIKYMNKNHKKHRNSKQRKSLQYNHNHDKHDKNSKRKSKKEKKYKKYDSKKSKKKDKRKRKHVHTRSRSSRWQSSETDSTSKSTLTTSNISQQDNSTSLASNDEDSNKDVSHQAEVDSLIEDEKKIEIESKQDDDNPFEQLAQNDLQQPMKSKKQMIDSLFGKNKCDDSDGGGGGDSDAGNSENSSDESFLDDDGEVNLKREKELEKLRRRLKNMQTGNDKSHTSLKSISMAVYAIQALQNAVEKQRPIKANAFKHGFNAVLPSFIALSKNLIVPHVQPVLRSLQRSDVSLRGFGSKSLSFFKSFLGRNDTPAQTRFIKVHTFKIIDCLNELTHNCPTPLLKFCTNFLLAQRHVCLKDYVLSNEEAFLQWDEYGCVIDYTLNKKEKFDSPYNVSVKKKRKMIILNFFAIRVLLQNTLIPSAQQMTNSGGKESQRNLFKIISLVYYIIRKYTTWLLNIGV